jgi:hypothetical protein
MRVQNTPPGLPSSTSAPTFTPRMPTTQSLYLPTSHPYTSVPCQEHTYFSVFFPRLATPQLFKAILKSRSYVLLVRRAFILLMASQWELTSTLSFPFSLLHNMEFPASRLFLLPPAFTLVACSAYSTKRMEAQFSSEKSTNFQRTICCYIPEDRVRTSNPK